MLTSTEIALGALKAGVTIPAFNIPYLPMVDPIVRAVGDTDCYGFAAVARPEWEKFEAKSIGAVMETYQAANPSDCVRLHLDHVPVIDEDEKGVDFIAIIEEAIALGYDSVMVDGSRLSLDANIAAAKEVADRAHAAGIPCEAELGAVFGHEAGPPPPYEELFTSGRGFTDVDEAKRFVTESGCDWLSVAVGSVHGAISGAMRHQKKVEARINIEHLEKLRDATGVPLVLHGGSGVKQEYILKSIKSGIAKINIGTEVRQVYEQSMKESSDVPKAQQAVYDKIVWMLNEYFKIAGTKTKVEEAWSAMK
jgi:ketose-bisphosphate aldolase